MELSTYSGIYATVINQLKKGIYEPALTRIGEHRRFKFFSQLPTELRLKIWIYCYLVPQPARIVEVRTPKHSNCPGHEGFCPRYSPTSKHPLVNTCHESREVARSEALKAGHLMFSSPFHSSASLDIIIFDPLSDLLYLPNELAPLPPTRGPRGTYTQYKKSPPPASPGALSFLAISQEIYGSQFNPMRLVIYDFPNLECLIFVAPDFKRANEGCDLQGSLKTLMAASKRRQRETEQFLSTTELIEIEMMRQNGEMKEREWPKVRVAVKCAGGRFEIVEKR